ncbi:FYN-binding protein 1 isoform X2 [Salarias fasciatus]|uniref:FYN-binding protein 1 isoform X2 n=1 Tax=Salarias fasciatus TaxID=181472 RepID=UPI001176617D|nr:FYN-binding protein 1-like isoform X2 [Salarias fasciatus]
MDQEGTMDFKALRAKFQDEELHLKQPRFKPALPDKPKVVPPPQSPTHYVPVGARPSLLTSINQSIEGKTLIAPRVVFKDDKKDMKKPLIQTNSKKKEKSEGKLKGGKDKTKESKEKLDEDSLDQKQKKDNVKDKKLSSVFPTIQKESTAELVQATPPPKSTVKKKGLLSLMKSSKRESAEITTEPILDTPSLDVPGPAPLIPVPSDLVTPQPEMSTPELLLLQSPTTSTSSAGEVTPSSTIPESPAFIPPPVFIPDIPEPEVPSTEFESQLQIKDPDFPDLRPDSPIEVIPSASSYSLSSPPPVVSASSLSLPEPELMVEPGIEAINLTEVEKPPVTDPPFFQPSPKAERPISALSALERAEDMSPEKKRISVDQRIFSALQKARRKTTSSLTNPTHPYSITPPPEEFPPADGLPPLSLDLPPIDYEGGAGSAHQPKQELVNGIDPGHVSPVLGDISVGLPDSPPEMLVVPPPPPRHSLPALSSLTPEKPDELPSTDLSTSIPTPLLTDNGLPFSPEFSETDTVEVPEFFDNIASDVPSPEIPTTQRPEFRAEPVPGGEHENNPVPLPSIPGTQDLLQVDSPQVENGNSPYESAENMYGDTGSSGTKKKGKPDGKKRKGPPKNPYVEAAQEPNQEKTKTGRFGKTEKKAVAEGPDEKELKKREKQRLEKEKKELKEKQEREKKEQKEREKKESELKKKFKITGQEDAIYQANVTVTTKGRKNDLPVKSGDVVSIIRTTNCPKGKWLARDSTNNYGYVAVDHVELDIKEMLELGKKARKTSSNVVEPDAANAGNRVSNHYPLSGESFEDDSEEWTGDDDEPVSPAIETADPLAALSHTRTLSMPEMPDTAHKDLSINHQHSHSDINADGSHMQAKHEALQKLATFFHSPKGAESATSNGDAPTSPAHVTEAAVQIPNNSSTQGIDLDDPMLILPPPDLYADLGLE